MKALRFLISWIFLTMVLLAAVQLMPLLEALNQGDPASASPDAVFSSNQLVFGILGEVARALLLLLLFPMMKDPGGSWRQSLLFGMLTSGLVWTLWVVYGSGTFQLNNRVGFFIEETIVFTIQGVFSGAGLHIIFTKIWKTTDHNQ